MENSIKPEEEQKETSAKAASGNAVSQNKNAGASGDQSSEPTNTVRKDPRAGQKLARKKRMKTAHRRRLKASYANG